MAPRKQHLSRSYIRRRRKTRPDIDLRAFKGTGHTIQSGDGWFSDIWEVLGPVAKRIILPRAKQYVGETVIPNLKRGLRDVKSDVFGKNRLSLKRSIVKRGKETLNRIKSRQHGGSRKRQKKRKKRGKIQ